MIILMRHGYTDYVQGNEPVSIEDANDLNEMGIREVARSSAEIANILPDSKKTVIYTSPLGRAIHTAKILKEYLEASGRKCELVPASELMELHNFRWSLFEETVRCSGIDTKDLPSDHWVALDLIHHLSDEAVRELPVRLREFVTAVESAVDANKRLMAFVGSTADDDCGSIYVTHDGLLCTMLKDLTDGAVMTCTRSHYFEIVPGEDGWKMGKTNLDLVL